MESSESDDFEANFEIDDIDFDVKCNKSQCAIRSVNELHKNLVKRGKDEAKCHVETKDNAPHSKAWAGARATDYNNGCLSSEAYAGYAEVKHGLETKNSLTGMANAEFGMGGAIADAEANANLYSFGDTDGHFEVGTARVGGGIGVGPGGVKAKVGIGVDAVKAKLRLGKRQQFDVSLGLSADTGLEFGWDGATVSAFGLGLAVGRNTGIILPFGKVVFKLW